MTLVRVCASALVILASCGRDASMPGNGAKEVPRSSTAIETAAIPAVALGSNSVPSTFASARPTLSEAPVDAVPATLLKVLETTPYVEVDCKPFEVPGFGAHAKKCAYTAMGLAAEVVIANPSAELTARWLTEASRSCAPLEAIRSSNTDAWERGVRAFARHLRLQSSRIFPLNGAIIEDLGDGPHAFEFDRGVVTPCSKGSCRCRINSLTASGLCRYRASLGVDRDACNKALSDDEAWRTQCVENHRAALESGPNEHLRARAFLVGEAVKKKCDARLARPKAVACQPFEIVLLIEDELGLTPK